MTDRKEAPKSVHDAIFSGLETILSTTAGVADCLVRRSISASWPGERLDEALTAESHGDLQPERIRTGRYSSLMAAIAVGVSSVRRTEDAQMLFLDLSIANKEPLSTTDRIKDADKRMAAVRNFKLPWLREVSIKPLFEPKSAALAQQGPLGNAFAAIEQGGAIIVPLLPGMIHERPRGRQIWGAITGFHEEIVMAGESDSDVEDEDRLHVSGKRILTKFVASLPLQNAGVLAMVKAKQLERLVDTRPAYAIRSTSRVSSH